MPGRFSAEQIFRGLLRGPLTTRTSSAPAGVANAWAGFVDVTTASATSSVATTLVDSDTIILFGQYGNTTTTSNAARTVLVTSINPGVGFTVKTSDATAPIVNYTIPWIIIRTQ